MTKLPKPKIPYDGWKIESDNKNCEYKNMVLHLEQEQKDGYIKGEILVERFKEKGLSASVLDYLLENLSKIPEDWKTDKNGVLQRIYFWGTIFRDSRGRLYVRYLVWRGGKWQSHYDWLGYGWDDDNPAAVSSTLPLDTETSLNPLDLEKRLKIVEDKLEKISEILK